MRTAFQRRATLEHRAGLLLMEVMAAAALVGIVLAIIVPILASVVALRTEADRRQQAQLEVANLMEQIANRHRAGETVAVIVPTIVVAPATVESLPQADLKVEAGAAAGLPDAVEVALKLTWMTGTGRTAAPVELHAFFVERASAKEAP